MKAVIRSFVRDETRFALLVKTLGSIVRAGFEEVIIVNDQSPDMWSERINTLASSNISVITTEGKPSVVNGLTWSLRQIAEGEELDTMLFCDDVVIDQGIKRLFVEPARKLDGITKGRWGTIGTFSILLWHERSHMRAGIAPDFITLKPKFSIDSPNFYHHMPVGCIANFYSRPLITAMSELEHIADARFAAEDRWIWWTCVHSGLPYYGTLVDFAEHTGVRHRSFSDERFDTFPVNYASGTGGVKQ